MIGLRLNQQPHSTTEARFYAVSVTKFCIMSMATLGLYNIYWFYQHWKRERDIGGADVSPVLRALFARIMAYSLFDRIRTAREVEGLSSSPSAGALALVYFLWSGLWRLPDPWWLISLLGFIPLIPVQMAANELNARLAPDAPRNSSFSAGEVVLIVLGGLFLLLAVIGTFWFPEAAPEPGSGAGLPGVA